MLRCYLMGQESLLIHCAETLIEKGHTVCGVISDAERVRDWATAQGLAVIDAHPRALKKLAQSLSQEFDYFFSITNLSVIPAEVFGKAARGAINFHDGPLPRYAGLHAPAWALMAQEPGHGITWHQMTADVDAGNILKQRLFDLREGETSFTLNTHCYEAAIESFAELVDELANGTATPVAQPAAASHYFARDKRPAAAATLRWSRPAAELDALVRALEFGPVENPLALAKFRLESGAFVMVKATRANATTVDDGANAPVGSITFVEDDALGVATGDGELVLTELNCPQGLPLAIGAWAAANGLSVGTRLPTLEESSVARITAVHEGLARHEHFWVKRLETFSAPAFPYAQHHQAKRGAEGGAGGAQRGCVNMTLPNEAAGLSADDLLAAVTAYSARICDSRRFSLAYRDRTLGDVLAGAADYFAGHVPLRVSLAANAGFAAWRDKTTTELKRIRQRKSYAQDTMLRYPQLLQRTGQLTTEMARLVVEQVESLDGCDGGNAELKIVIAADGSAMHWHHDSSVFSAAAIATMQAQFLTLLQAMLAEPERAIVTQPLLPAAERQRLLVDSNDTAADFPRDACIHTLFEQQVARTPDAIALSCLGEELSYAQLNAKANKLAHYLRTLGVKPDVLVGVCVERSLDMMVATLGVMKAGGAYVPMDPEYPPDRIAIMLEDSHVSVLLTQKHLQGRLPTHSATTHGATTHSTKTVCVDTDDYAHGAEEGATLDTSVNPASGVTPNNIAYTIYTSGSTGRPKGVMVEHRNVVNFFSGMDQQLAFAPGDDPGVWLALTSLSFDISVLELFWTLARGFKVVLHADKADDTALARAQQQHADKPITFSLMYFASDEGENESSADKYKLLLEGAKFGDRNGFSAVWTPERHFHAFGGLYPNPSVASAAIATITKNINIRAASVVAPLHHPVRIAEEWSLVDNLSNGRVGISFASGWQPNDFVIYKPERFKERKEAMMDTLDMVRRLWRGEKYKATSPLGKEIEVTTLPRPVQKELPFWLTAAGNPATFRAAGEVGANLLTHLLGQSVEELAGKIRVYREAWDKAGHSGRGLITVMLHTFVGPDAEEVKETVREPMKSYLRSSLHLIKLAAYEFPTFKQKADASGKTPAQIFEEEELSDEDMDVLLDFSFERYYQSSGLFGTPQSCLQMIDSLKGIDVDDVGCLLDYGVPSAKVLEHLPYINELRDLATAHVETAASDAVGQGDNVDYSLASQIARHGVTHMQCTPSQMTLIVAGDDSRAALGKVSKVLVGGEAFPLSLAQDLEKAVSGTIINMYGPTETTIWSSTQEVRDSQGAVPIGRPIANTQIYLLDSQRQPVPTGVAGELYIAGDGVVRGYYERPDLTEQRFLPDPFAGVTGARMYRTGDLARYREDGVIEFLGRVDFQVKLRGYRIELGEIEVHLAADPSVQEAVVVAREDVPGDKRLVAYLVPSDDNINVDTLREALKEKLPAYMLPQSFVVLKKFPLTPNNKVDRNALLPPEQAQGARQTEYVQPSGDLEASIASVWGEVLNVKKVGMDDNFFDLGGHSLLTVQVHRRLKTTLETPLSLTDLFRFPTIRALVSFIQQGDGTAHMDQGRDRAAARKDARARRAKMRDRRRKR